MEANYQLASDLFHLCIVFMDNYWQLVGTTHLRGSILQLFICTNQPLVPAWEIVSHMTTGWSCCFTALLPDNRLMVMGGHTDGGVTDAVELATVCHYN